MHRIHPLLLVAILSGACSQGTSDPNPSPASPRADGEVDGTADSRSADPGDTLAALAPPEAAAGCVAKGHVRGRLVGSIDGNLDWSGATLRCEGMPRPGGRGARMRFAFADHALIIALPDLERGVDGRELPANVTLIDEANGRFFGTADVDSCWADVVPQPGDPGRLDGRLYCIAPLAEINGDGTVTIAELSFAGIVDWSAS